MKQTLRTIFFEFSVQYFDRLKGFEGSEHILPVIVLWTKFSSLRLTAVMMVWYRRRKMAEEQQMRDECEARQGPGRGQPKSQYYY